MKIVIVGAGEVGSYLCEMLSLADHDVTLIERDQAIVNALNEHLDARIIRDHGGSTRVLLKAGVQNCDFFLAMTSSDETNLVSASLAKALGAKKTFARVHDSTFRDNTVLNYQQHFGIDHLVNPEALAAVELAKHIRNPGRVAVEDFGRGQIEVKSVEIQPGARVIGSPLSKIKLPGNLRIGLINREEKTYVANARSILQKGDHVTLFGHPDSLFEANQYFDPNSKGSKKITVTLLSGSEIAISLVRLLSNPRFKIRIIENDLSLCHTLTEGMPNLTIINGDGTSRRILEEEEVGGSDFFVACSKDDEDNIMTCLQAHRLGATHSMLAINRADYLEILGSLNESLGIEYAVSPRVATSNEVMRYIGSKKPYIEIETASCETSCIIEVNIGEKSQAAGLRVRDVSWPDECVLVGHEHEYSPKTPTGDDVLRAGDSIIVIISKPKIPELITLTK
ncbi:Trk system potassium transporter TrkA [Puniceicoccaceae bacterium K14]|nr:Trk system potassium transporter TrkA [Puniceicoccaceae bacterium K14]